MAASLTPRLAPRAVLLQRYLFRQRPGTCPSCAARPAFRNCPRAPSFETALDSSDEGNRQMGRFGFSMRMLPPARNCTIRARSKSTRHGGTQKSLPRRSDHTVRRSSPGRPGRCADVEEFGDAHGAVSRQQLPVDEDDPPPKAHQSDESAETSARALCIGNCSATS